MYQQGALVPASEKREAATNVAASLFASFQSEALALAGASTLFFEAFINIAKTRSEHAAAIPNMTRSPTVSATSPTKIGPASAPKTVMPSMTDEIRPKCAGAAAAVM